MPAMHLPPARLQLLLNSPRWWWRERERVRKLYIHFFILFSLSLCLFFPFLSIVRSLQDQSGRWQRGDKAQQIVNDNEAERLFEMRQEEKRNMKDLKNLGEILEILCEICEYLWYPMRLLWVFFHPGLSSLGFWFPGCILLPFESYDHKGKAAKQTRFVLTVSNSPIRGGWRGLGPVALDIGVRQIQGSRAICSQEDLWSLGRRW